MFFPTSIVIKAVKNLQRQKLMDHAGLQVEHFIYAREYYLILQL